MTAIEEEELRRALDASVEEIIDAIALSVKTGYVVHPTKKVISKLHGRHEIMKMFDAYVSALSQQHEREIVESYLSHFSYVDWDIGEDDKLRLGDFINCNHQRPYDGYEQNFEGQIVAHHVNSLPVILYNLDPKEPDNSGDYADLQSLMMDGWEFSRIKERQQQSNGGNEVSNKRKSKCCGQQGPQTRQGDILMMVDKHDSQPHPHCATCGLSCEVVEVEEPS